MATVRQVKQWLENFDDDTEVQIIVNDNIGSSDPGSEIPLLLNMMPTETGEIFSSSKTWHYIDYTKSPTITKTHPYYGKKVLILGHK